MRNETDFKSAAISLYAGIAILLLLPLTPSDRAVAQTYGWHTEGCPWSPYNATGPFATATEGGDACVAAYYSLAPGSILTWLVGPEFTGMSVSDPPCTEPPTSAGVQCYDELSYSESGSPYILYTWMAYISESTPQFWINGNSAPQGEMCSANCVGHPINPATGNVLSVETDIAFHGAGTIAYQRYYNSADSTGADGVPGWRHSYDRYVNVIYSNPVGAYDTGGRLLIIAILVGSYRLHVGLYQSQKCGARLGERHRLVFQWRLRGKRQFSHHRSAADEFRSDGEPAPILADRI